MYQGLQSAPEVRAESAPLPGYLGVDLRVQQQQLQEGWGLL